LEIYSLEIIHSVHISITQIVTHLVLGGMIFVILVTTTHHGTPLVATTAQTIQHTAAKETILSALANQTVDFVEAGVFRVQALMIGIFIVPRKKFMAVQGKLCVQILIILRVSQLLIVVFATLPPGNVLHVMDMIMFGTLKPNGIIIKRSVIPVLIVAHQMNRYHLIALILAFLLILSPQADIEWTNKCSSKLVFDYFCQEIRPMISIIKLFLEQTPFFKLNS